MVSLATTRPKAADHQCQAYKNLGERKHIQFRKSFQSSVAPIIMIGDSVAAGLRRYGHACRNCFKDALNLGISGHHVENVLQRGIFLSYKRYRF